MGLEICLHTSVINQSIGVESKIRTDNIDPRHEKKRNKLALFSLHLIKRPLNHVINYRASFLTEYNLVIG